MRPFRISLIGLDTWEWNFVTATIEIASGSEVAAWVCVPQAESPDVLLVRPDSGAVESGGPIIIACGDAAAHDKYVDAVRLERPITYPGLITALRTAEDRLRRPRTKEPPSTAVTSSAETATPATTPTATAATESAAAVALAPTATAATEAAVEAALGPPEATAAAASPAPLEPVSTVHAAAIDPAGAGTPQDLAATLAHCARPSRRFREDSRLLGIAQSASLRSGITEISHAGFPTLTIVPAELSYVCAVDPAMVASMFRAPAWGFTTRELDPVAAAVTIAGLPRRPLWRLLYCAALFGSEARIYADAGPNDTLHLLGEPDFDRLPHDEQQRRIATYLLVHTDTLLGIANAVGAPLDAVIDFCNACEQLGLIERNGAPVRGAVSPGAHGRRHSLANALSRLKGWFR